MTAETPAGAAVPSGAAPRETNEGLAALGQTLARLYRFPVDDADADVFASMDPADTDDPFMDDERYRAGVKALQEQFCGGERAAVLRSASDDFHKLFVGPLTLRAIPWSSAYLDSDGLFGPTARAVREAFAAEGLAIPEGRTEPSDHIAYELQFLAEMHDRAASCWGASELPSDEARTMLSKARAFRGRFVDPWVGEFLGRVDRGSRVATYRGVANLTRGFLTLEERFFARVLEA